MLIKQWKLHIFYHLLISPIADRESNGMIDHSELQKERKDESERKRKRIGKRKNRSKQVSKQAAATTTTATQH